MDRRDFLKKAGIGAAGMSLAACTSGKEKKTVIADKGPGKMSSHSDGVSLLGYGCMRWPMIKDAEGKDIVDQEKVNEMVDTAIAHGVNYFDCAPVYLQGLCEEATARALARHPRESYYIATKCSNHRGSDWKYETGIQMYKRSLNLFNTDHIDYYLLHNVNSADNLQKRFIDNGLLDYFLKERESGHIRNLGYSFHGGRQGFDEVLSLHEKYHWDFIQIQLNYIDWDKGTDCDASYMYEEISKRGIAVVIMEPLLGGRLSNIPAALAAQLKARRPQDSIASWAFRFAGNWPGVLTVLSGMTYIEHLRDNLETYEHFEPLDGQELALLADVAASIRDFPLVSCTGCQYCMPCPYGIDIPSIFKFYNAAINEGTYVKSGEQKDYARARRRYLASYDKSIESVRQADHCIGCNQCQPKCPQRIRIPNELRRIDTYIENIKKGTV